MDFGKKIRKFSILPNICYLYLFFSNNMYKLMVYNSLCCVLLSRTKNLKHSQKQTNKQTKKKNEKRCKRSFIEIDKRD